MSRPLAIRIRLSMIGAAIFVALSTAVVHAGGPLFVFSNLPVRWPQLSSQLPVSGGKLNLQTVDAQGNVIYRVDAGGLGPLSNAQAVHIVDRIFGNYSSIPTSTLRLTDGGPILDPDTGKPVDVNQKNFGKFISPGSQTFNNPIIFDQNGKITDDDLVLGFFGTLSPDALLFDGIQNEGYVV
ncbi:MAG TPA: hypothetical protein VLZ81_16185, partial [Blastocatellia bacterium]|nr:hypothetical protein [Blastocatellia bacterium]